MSVTLPSLRPFEAHLSYVVSGLMVAAIAVGALLMQQGPDLSLQPTMADRAFSLPNGDRLFVQRHEVTVAEWNTCVEKGGCSLLLRVRPDQDATTTPATGLSFLDVQEYIAWINDATGHVFRLPTASEWKAMAVSVLPEAPDPLFTDPSLTWASAYLIEGTAPRALKPQGSFSTSPEGIADLDGSVWEWTQECYAAGGDSDRCPAYLVGGEHVAAMSYLIRDPARGGCAVGSPPAHLGVRLVTNEALHNL